MIGGVERLTVLIVVLAVIYLAGRRWFAADTAQVRPSRRSPARWYDQFLAGIWNQQLSDNPLIVQCARRALAEGVWLNNYLFVAGTARFTTSANQRLVYAARPDEVRRAVTRKAQQLITAKWGTQPPLRVDLSALNFEFCTSESGRADVTFVADSRRLSAAQRALIASQLTEAIDCPVDSTTLTHDDRVPDVTEQPGTTTLRERPDDAIASVVVTDGGVEVGRTFLGAQSQVALIIGRNPGCGICVADSSVSDRHLALTAHDGCIYVEDHSSYGTTIIDPDGHSTPVARGEVRAVQLGSRLVLGWRGRVLVWISP